MGNQKRSSRPPHELQVSNRCATAVYVLKVLTTNELDVQSYLAARTSVALPTSAYDALATKEDVLLSFLVASLFIIGIRFVIRTAYEVRGHSLCIPGAS